MRFSRNHFTLCFILAFVSLVKGVSEEPQPWEQINGCEVLKSTSTLKFPYCALCNEGYVNQEGKCEFNIVGVNRANCMQTVSSTSSPDKIKCQICTKHYIEYNYECSYICTYSQQFKSISTDCLPTCNIKECKYCSTLNENKCLLCSVGLMQEGFCVNTCTDGFYQDSTNQFCLPCNSSCKTCRSSPTECLSCPTNNFLVKSSCKAICPYQYYISQAATCSKYCKEDFTYPVFTQEGNFETCSNVSQNTDSYCLNNLKALGNSNNLLFKLVNTTQLFTLSVEIMQTPSACYTYELYGNTNQIAIFNKEQRKESYYVEFNFAYSMIEEKQINCMDSCILDLYVYWLEQLQYIYKIYIQANTNLILTNNFFTSGKSGTVIVVCQQCEIPISKIASSTLVIKCSGSQICLNNQIKTQIGSVIEITQYVEKAYSKNKLIFHSIKIVQGTQEVFLKNPIVDNTILGQITYKFEAFASTNGTIVISSVITNAITTPPTYLRVLVDESEAIYPQLQFSILVIPTETNNQGPLNPLYSSPQAPQNPGETTSLYMVVVIIIGCIVFFALLLYFINHKYQFCKIGKKYKQSANTETEQP